MLTCIHSPVYEYLNKGMYEFADNDRVSIRTSYPTNRQSGTASFISDRIRDNRSVERLGLFE